MRIWRRRRTCPFHRSRTISFCETTLVGGAHKVVVVLEEARGGLRGFCRSDTSVAKRHGEALAARVAGETRPSFNVVGIAGILAACALASGVGCGHASVAGVAGSTAICAQPEACKSCRNFS